MNSTKRKFNALLNGLGNKSNSSSSQKSDVTTPLASQNASLKERGSFDSQYKKRRTEYPPTISTVPSNLGSLSTFSSTRQKGASTTISTETQPPPSAPTYQPWDRNAFLERLKTFANLTDWLPKPDRVNEVAWAKRGWVCGKKERVRCVSCHVELLVRLNKKVLADGSEEGVYVAANIDVEDQVVDKYAELIVAAHAQDCLWKVRGCDDTIFKLSLNNSATTIRALKERYHGLMALGDALPFPSDMHLSDDFDLDKVISYLPPDFFSPPIDPELPSAHEPNRVALTLSLFGWAAMPNYTHSAVECAACFRRLGLWLFKSHGISPTGSAITAAAMSHLDPAQEHRDYCPWKNAVTQSGGGAATRAPAIPQEMRAAWEIVVRVLRNDHVLRNPPRRDPARRSLVVGGEGEEGQEGWAGEDEGEDARSVREEKEREWGARLRRVKSLFNLKEKKRLNRMSAPAPAAAEAKQTG